jgi:ABC-type phosphate transport system permease subunit
VKIAGYVLFMVAFVFYAAIWLAIWQLVSESRQASPDKHFGRFWWLPAWRFHKNSYPASHLRRKIVFRFILTFAVLSAAMACVGYSALHPYRK